MTVSIFLFQMSKALQLSRYKLLHMNLIELLIYIGIVSILTTGSLFSAYSVYLSEIKSGSDVTVVFKNI
jgi:hypothetical protein